MDLEEIKKEYPEFTGKAGPRLEDMTGKRFGQLIVLYRYYKNNRDNKAQ